MFKSAIVNTLLGRIAQGLRGQLQLHRAAVVNLEELGSIANDAIARTLVERLCADERIFIDVGAHIGAVIDGVRRHSSPSHVVAIEAVPTKADTLRRKFPWAEVHCCAAGEREGAAAFFVDADRPGYSSLDPALGARGAAVDEIRVRLRRLDDLIGPDGVDLIKIDVEGAELGVLRGAETIVATSRPTILFESGPTEMAGFGHAALWQWLDARDYAVLIPSRVAHDDGGMSLETFLELHLYPRRTTNYFAIARERRVAIRNRARTVLGFE